MPVLLAAVVGVVASPRPARAAACCVSAATGGVGRLRIWEQYATGLSASYGLGIGYWDPDSRWHRYRGYGENELRLSWWALGRLGRRWQAWVSLPGLVTWRRAGALHDTNGAVADAQIGVRWDPVLIGEYLGVPGVAVVLTLTAPTGRAPWHSRGDLGADITGRGAWVPAVAVVLEKTHLPWFFQLQVGADVPLPLRRPDTGQEERLGPGVSASFSTGAELVPDVLVLSGSLHGSWHAPVHLAGAVVPNSSQLTTGLGASLSWAATPAWTLVGGVDTGLFFDYLGDNLPGKVDVSVTIRHNTW